MAKKKVILINVVTGEMFDVYVSIEDYFDLLPVKDIGFVIAEESDWKIDQKAESITH